MADLIPASPMPTVLLSVARDRKSGSAGMPRPISYAVFCLKKKKYAEVSVCSRQRSSYTGKSTTYLTNTYQLLFRRVNHIYFFFFFFNDTATTEIYTLSLHDALPIYSTRNKTRDGLIRVRNIRALNGRFNTSITHAYSIVIGSKHITLNATGGGFLTASKQFRHGATSKSRSNTASNSTKHKSPHLSGWRQIISLIT